MKDYRGHLVATLFGQVTVRLPRFRCAGCGGSEAGHGWPSHCRSTLELDRIQAHLSALMTYRVAANVMVQMFPVGAGNDAETVRCHTLNIGEGLRDKNIAKPETAAPAIAVTTDATARHEYKGAARVATLLGRGNRAAAVHSCTG